MSKNRKTVATLNDLVERANARADRVVETAGAFGQRWHARGNGATAPVFNPYVARAGEIQACVRLTKALLREGECINLPPVRAVMSDGCDGWEWVGCQALGEGEARFIGPWLTETRVGGTWSSLRPIRVARVSSPEQKEAIERQKALVGWLHSAADLAEEMKRSNDRLGLTCLRKFFEAGVTGDGNGPNSPYCSHVKMGDVVGRMSPARLVRRMIEVRYATLRRMHPLAGVITTPSWAAVSVAAVQGLPVGKASIVAMAMTLAMPRLAEGGGELRYYRNARQWLADNLATSADKVETVEGVTTVTHPAVVIHGVQVSNTIELRLGGSGGAGTAGRVASMVGKVGDFVYHSNYSSAKGLHRFARETLRAFRKNRKAMAAALGTSEVSRALITAVQTGAFVVLATRQDSYAAGNCEPGTCAFIQSQGWVGKPWVDAAVLLKSGNPRAVAAGLISCRRAIEWITKMNISL